LIVGLLLLAYAVASMFTYPLAGYVILFPASYLFLLSFTYNVVLYTARLGAWLGTLWSKDKGGYLQKLLPSLPMLPVYPPTLIEGGG
jgi:hypothetical protein